ncbi:MAG: hypothetical protein ACFFAS_13050 [Promethearchaeota archaeon]
MKDQHEIIQSKIVILLFQLAFLSAFIYGFGHSFSIQFDEGIDDIQIMVIQYLANLIMCEGTVEFIFMYYAWTVVLLIAAFILRSTRKTFFTNLTIFFILNFFFYIYLSRHSPNFYGQNSQGMITQTIFLSIYIAVISIFSSQVIKMLFKSKEEPLLDIQQIEYKDKYVCPHCGVEFGSLPQYCYNCLEKLDIKN